MLQRHLISFCYCALFAAWLSAVAPTVAYLLAASNGQQVVELCSSFGIKKVIVPVQSSPDEPGPLDSAKHCPFCLAGQDSALFTSPGPGYQPVRVAQLPDAWSSVLTPPGHWQRARPREPPDRTA